MRRRLAISGALGLLAGYRAYLHSAFIPKPRDFTQVWYAARAVLHGQDPYALIGPGRVFDWPWPFFYPLPAALAAIPLAPFSAMWACTLFMVISGACFAWALMEHGYAPLLGFFSASMVLAAEVVQWSPILTASLVLPALGLLGVAKPPIGAALWCARPNRWTIVGGLILTAIAFLLQPHWLSAWREGFDPARIAANSGLHFSAPILRPGGALVLLALARWRRPEARLIVALACVPQTLIVYETVPLMLVPRTVRESALLCVLSYVAHLGVVVTSRSTISPTGGWWLVVFLYLPATIMVLRRPNVGDAAGWPSTRSSPTSSN